MSKYSVSGPVGAFGDNASASNFQQFWQSVSPSVDLPKLSQELATLISEIQPLARDSGHFASMTEAISAKEAAEKSDGPTALEHLKKVGTWFWEMARKVGVGVATAAALHALGIK